MSLFGRAIDTNTHLQSVLAAIPAENNKRTTMHHPTLPQLPFAVMILLWVTVTTPSTVALDSLDFVQNSICSSSSSLLSSSSSSQRHLAFSGQVTAWELIDTRTSTSTKVMDLVNGAIVTSENPSFSINAIVSGTGISSVRLTLDGNFTNIEDGAPYALCRNTGTTFQRCKGLMYGTHTVTGAACSASGGRGTCQVSPTTLVFEIRRPTSAPVAPAAPVAPTKAPTNAPVAPMKAPELTTKAPVVVPTKAPVKAPTSAPIGLPTALLPMGLTLMNANSDLEIGVLSNDSVINLAQTPRINVRADVPPTMPKVSSV
jgi:hypothetical protein